MASRWIGELVKLSGSVVKAMVLNIRNRALTVLAAMETLACVQAMLILVARIQRSEKYPIVVVNERAKELVIGLLTISPFASAAKIMCGIGISAMIPQVGAANINPVEQVISTVSGQLAQNAVLAAGAVFLATKTTNSIIDILVEGPLASARATAWCLGVFGNDKGDKEFKADTDTNGDAKTAETGGQLAKIICWLLTTILCLVLSFAGHHPNGVWWGRSIFLTYVLTEVVKSLCAYAMKSWHKVTVVPGVCTYGTWQRYKTNQLFTVTSAKEVKALATWADITTSTTNMDACYATVTVHASWKSVFHGLATAALAMLAMVLSVVHSSTVVISGNVGALAGLYCCMMAFIGSSLITADFGGETDSEAELRQKVRGAVSMLVFLHPTPNECTDLTLAVYTLQSILMPNQQVRYKNCPYKAGSLGKEIDLHELFQGYSRQDRTWARMAKTRTRDGRSIWFEIGDALHLLAYTIIRHGDWCQAGCEQHLPGKATSNNANVMSLLLAASGHADCVEVASLIDNFYSWVTPDLCYHVLGAATMDVLGVKERREMVAHSNPFIAATNLIQLIEYKTVNREMSIRERCIQLLHNLVTGTTILGYSPLWLLQCSHDNGIAVDMVLSPNSVLCKFGEYTLSVTAQLRKMPAACPPQLKEADVIDTPRLLTLARMYLNPTVVRQTVEATIQELDVQEVRLPGLASEPKQGSI